MINKMKKYFWSLIISICATLSLAHAQVPGSVFSGNGPPSGSYRYFSSDASIYCDTLNKTYFVKKSGIWFPAPGYNGGTVSFAVGTVTTLPAGSMATVTNVGTATNVILDFGIPQGTAGGGGGPSGWVEDVFTGPDKYSAIHSQTTFAGAGYSQAQVDSGWPGIGAVTTDMIDWAAWQLAVIDACQNGKTIVAYGNYYVNKSIQAEDFFESLVIQGGYAQIWTTNSTAYDVIGRPAPADNNEALIMTNSMIKITDLQISTLVPNNNQVGIELGPSYGSVYDGVRVVEMAEAIHLRFALNTTVRNCFAFGCDIGWTADMGDWTGATNSNSQSNVTTFTHCRAYMTGGDYAFGIFAASGCEVNTCIIEGTQCENAIDYDALGSVNVYNFSVSNIHVECSFDSEAGAASSTSNTLTVGSHTFTVAAGLNFPTGYPIRLSSAGNGYMEGTVTSYNAGTGGLVVNITSVPAGAGGPYTNWAAVIMLGCTNAAVKIRGLAGIFSLDGAYGQYASILVDAEATLSNFNVHIAHVYSWVPFLNGPSFGGNPNSNKYFRSRTTAQAWYFEWNDALAINEADLVNKFINNNGMGGTAASAVTSAVLGTDGNGNSRYIGIPSPR